MQVVDLTATTAIDAAFNAIDVNGDGVIDRGEWERASPSPSPTEDLVASQGTGQRSQGLSPTLQARVTGALSAYAALYEGGR